MENLNYDNLHVYPEDSKDLYGAKFSDEFKYQHKQQLPDNCYASDADLVLLSKYPPGIVAFFDYKFPHEPLTFAEVLLYNEWSKFAPVFLVLSDKPKTGPFTIKRYLIGDWKPNPPIVQCYKKIRILPDWEAFKLWELQLRQTYEECGGWETLLRGNGNEQRND